MDLMRKKKLDMPSEKEYTVFGLWTKTFCDEQGVFWRSVKVSGRRNCHGTVGIIKARR